MSNDNYTYQRLEEDEIVGCKEFLDLLARFDYDDKNHEFVIDIGSFTAVQNNPVSETNTL